MTGGRAHSQVRSSESGTPRFLRVWDSEKFSESGTGEIGTRRNSPSLGLGEILRVWDTTRHGGVPDSDFPSLGHHDFSESGTPERIGPGRTRCMYGLGIAHPLRKRLPPLRPDEW